MENNESCICKECGGECCKNMGCHFSPRDFKEISFEYLKEKILEGYISIDWWDGEIRNLDRYQSYYLRMRNVDAPIIDPSWGGRCCKLTPTGCSFTFEDRPLGGKALIPRKSRDERCVVEYSKEDCAFEWIQYDDILTKLVTEFDEVAIKRDDFKSLFNQFLSCAT